YIKGVFDWDWPSSVAEFLQAIKANPNSTVAHHRLGDIFASSGQLDKWLAEMKRARDLDPLSLAINSGLSDALCFTGQQDEAIELLKRQIELDPSFPLAHNILGRVYLRKTDLTHAIIELETADVLAGSEASIQGDLGFAYARAGRTAEAQKVLGRLEEL